MHPIGSVIYDDREIRTIHADPSVEHVHVEITLFIYILERVASLGEQYVVQVIENIHRFNFFYYLQYLKV